MKCFYGNLASVFLSYYPFRICRKREKLSDTHYLSCVRMTHGAELLSQNKQYVSNKLINIFPYNVFYSTNSQVSEGWVEKNGE